MRRLCRLCPPWLMLAALAACQSQTVAMPTETQALLVQPTAAAQKELQATVARMLSAPTVAVAGDALQSDSLMIIEQTRHRDAKGLQLSGRDFGKPEQFRLLKIGDACVLVRLHTGARAVLRESRCAAAK
jgi:hypothetical protein